MEKSTLHETLWRQGSVIPRELVEPGILPEALDKDAKLIIVTHDCDVVNGRYDIEPYIEFFIARPTLAKDSRTSNGKNPRVLQFPASVDMQPVRFQVSVHEKHRMSRQQLERGGPDLSVEIDPKDIRMLARWTGKRYDRPAFPTAFNDRLAKVRDKIGGLMEKKGRDITGVFVAFLEEKEPGELANDEVYRIHVRVVAPRDAFDNGVREQDLLKVAAELTKLLGNCSGIDLIETVELRSEAEFTLEDWRSSKLWDYEYVSDANEYEHTYLG